jgi:2-hydroxy-4-carboxymuconate semialdehyde hemiacetal dehydrogenase
MSIRVAIIGYGAVAAVHAQGLGQERDVELVSVFGRKREKVSQFASAHGIPHLGDTLEQAVALADAAIVASPTALHFEQARQCLRAGVHTLVEMPPCVSAQEAQELAALAQQQGVRLSCAHTSRYLAPYARITASLRAGELGAIQDVHYVRHHQLRERSWTDDALLHHAAHPIDLLLHWFEGLEPLACVTLPQVRNAQTVSLLGKLPHGAPAALTVTYASRLPHTRMYIVGAQHTLETDGFSYIRSDLASLEYQGEEQAAYEQAIHDQDMDFLRSCHEPRGGVPWEETVRLMQTVNRFQELANLGIG